MFTATAGSGSLLLPQNLNSTACLRRNNHHRQPITSLPPPNSTACSLSPLKISLKQPLKLHSLKPQNSRLLTFSSLNPNFPQISPENPQFITNSTKTLNALFSLSSKIAQIIRTQFLNLKTLYFTASSQLLETLQYLLDNVVSTLVPLFLSVPSRSQVPPLTAIASGMAKWLDIYSGVLMVRVLLSWFPNMPWEMQPFSAIRDLTDPYLSLFRKIVPPVFGTIDVSPLLAFAVLGTLGSILGTAKV
ncbi:ylmG homolog protein 1-2, chloroplastic [Spinacia oleracea]|uniref:YlmG homolog protein 1-2, chloroplastic n=1 Tax=Spinacia oleracea TaxID=3562 RepID=A0ABM3QPH9_SPIOL|nr:ylmG homolog protein 1-2, chloroplastic-like [Spinacia oleracea]